MNMKARIRFKKLQLLANKLKRMNRVCTKQKKRQYKKRHIMVKSSSFFQQHDKKKIVGRASDVEIYNQASLFTYEYIYRYNAYQ